MFFHYKPVLSLLNAHKKYIIATKIVPRETIYEVYLFIEENLSITTIYRIRQILSSFYHIYF